MRKFRFLIGAMCLCMSLVPGGCSDDGKDNGDPAPPAGGLKDAYVFDGVKTGIRSMFFEKTGEYNYLFLSPDKVDNYDELLAQDDRDEFIHPFIELLVEPSLVGKTVDVKTETDYFAFYNMTPSQDEFESVETDMTEQVSSGSFTVTVDAEKSTVCIEFRFTLVSGKVFEGNCTTGYEAPEEPDMPDAEPNTYSVDGVKGSLGSVFAFDYYDMIYLAMTPVPGLGSWEEVYDQDEYVAAAFDPSLLGRKVDLMTEMSMFQFEAVLDAIPDFAPIGNGGTDGIVAGTLRSSLKDGKLTVVFDLTQDDGKKLVVCGQADYAAPEAPDNYLTIDDEVKEIKSAFYENTDAGSWIRFSVANLTDVEFPDEVLPDSRHYTMLYLDENLMRGDDEDITKLSKGFEFTYGGYVADTEGGITQFARTIEAGDLKGATGTFNVVKSGSTEGKYTVSFDFVLGDGTTVSGVYAGTCLPYRVAKKNEYGYAGGTMRTVGSVVIDRTKTPCEIWIAAEPGLTTVAAAAASSDPVKLTLPADAFDGNAKGFSAVPQASVMYDGVTYSNASGNPGNISAAVGGGNAVVTFNVWKDVGDSNVKLYVKGYFSGAVTEIK